MSFLYFILLRQDFTGLAVFLIPFWLVFMFGSYYLGIKAFVKNDTE